MEREWDKFINGKNEALVPLYKELSVSLLLLSIRYTHDRECSKDIVSEVFLYLLETPTKQRKEKWLGIEQVHTYLRFMVRNKSVDFIRNRQNQSVHLEQLHNYYLLHPNETLIETLKELLSTLPNTENKKIFTAHLEGYDNHELAEKFTLSEKTVRNKLSLVRKAIAVLWNKKLWILWIHLIS
jgi:RNA polymerase sigma factor (sigma-70 family)